MDGNNIISTSLLIVSSIFIIIFAYYTTIIIGKNSGAFLGRRYVRVLDKTNIGLNTSILILEINKKIYIIAQQTKNIELIDVIDAKDWDYFNDKDGNNPLNKGCYEKSYVNKITNKFKDRQKKRYSQNGSEKNE